MKKWIKVEIYANKRPGRKGTPRATWRDEGDSITPSFSASECRALAYQFFEAADEINRMRGKR